jgi:four helix bundle protein
MDLVIEIYKLSDGYPPEEKYGLVAETRKTSRSIPYNIAEGRRRYTRKDYRHFLTMAYGSGGELETQIDIAKKLGYCCESNFKTADSLLLEVMKMLNVMKRALDT